MIPELSSAVWRKSSYSDGGASNCVEVADNDLGIVPVRDSKQPHGPVVVFGASTWSSFTTAVWRKSSYSDGGGTNCLEVADHHPGIVPVRDSKTPHGPVLVFRSGPWAAFLSGVKG